MALADALIAVMWIGVTCYALFGGADFGAGIWDLLAGTTKRGAGQRSLIEHSIGPVWETNHVWLIFILVVMWTGFPGLFAAVSSTLYIPLTFAALGIIARGSAFAFRKAVSTTWQKRLFGATFASSSVLTPFFLGTVAGAVASGRVPPGVGNGDAITSWWNPVSVFSGAMAVGVCAYLAAVYLTADARRGGHAELAALFRRRALASGVLVGALALAGISILHTDAPRLADGLTGRALSITILSGVGGLGSLVLLATRRYTLARVSAATAVAAVLWAWAVAQYPHLLQPGLTIAQARAEHAVLVATLISLGVGAALLVPSLAWLYALFQRPAATPAAALSRRPDQPGRGPAGR
jgi:cytochrome d ubiquinol oxidase subunit II